MTGWVVGTSDPEWLPSTIVQSSAALVAIVGGLLVTRLVGVSSARGGLAQRERELTLELELARVHLQELEERRVNWDRADFFESAAWAYYRDGVREPARLAREVDIGNGPDERVDFAEAFLAYARDTEPQVRRVISGGVASPSLDDLRAEGVVILAMHEPVVKEMVKQFKPRRSDPLGLGGFDADLLVPHIADESGRTVTMQRWDALLHDIETAERRVEQLERTYRLTMDQLIAITPTGVFGVLGALGAVMVAGVAFPVVVMSFRWPDLSAPWRAGLVAAFLGSVAGLGVYIHRLASSIVSNRGGGPGT